MDRQWLWQTCTEFGWYPTTNQRSGVFGHSVPLEYFQQTCRNVFGHREFSHENMGKYIAATNIEYGGFAPVVNNIVFVHGSIDPWHPMGVLEDLHEGATSIFIPGASHCADMDSDKLSDSEELKAARMKIGQLIKVWVSNARK